jgi:hypothetical protein
MTGFIEDMLLKQEGLSDQDVADLNAILPDIQVLDQLILAQLPRITRVATKGIPIINKIIAKQRSLS